MKKNSDFNDTIDTLNNATGIGSPVFAADIVRGATESFVKYDPVARKFHAKQMGGPGKPLRSMAQKGFQSAIANPLNKVQSMFKPQTFDKIRKGYRVYGRGMNALGIAGLAIPFGHFAYTAAKAKWNEKKAPKAKTASLRPALEMEIPRLYAICCQYKKEFVINSKTAHALTADRLLHQDTYIMGDQLGFINGGYRPLQEKNAYYIRFVYVDPAAQGGGIARAMISELMQTKQASEGYWMQICRDNIPMQKVAAGLGFELIDEWDQGTDLTGIWYRS